MPIPDVIQNVVRLHTGTAFVIGDPGSRIGKGLTAKCYFEGKLKRVSFDATDDQAGFVNTAILCDQGFAPDGRPHIQFFNPETSNWRPISSREEMVAATEVIMTFDASAYPHTIQNRNGGAFEMFRGETLCAWIPYNASMGLVKGGLLDDGGRWAICLGDELSDTLHALIEVPAAPGGKLAAYSQALRADAFKLRVIAGCLQIRFATEDPGQNGEIVQPMREIASRLVELVDSIEGKK